ncbi:stress responsive A/B barrel domain protein [Xylariaceae sp. FL0016]|nr:stress responsive A/B barrel domain protein [Xylariaceae sp. FL0016]
MTIVHIVLFKFKDCISESHRQTFVTELRRLKELPCVLNSQLVVGGPSITDPIEKSQGFQYALVSYHRDSGALAEYQASDEHHRVTSTYLWPFKEDVIRFDFEVGEGNEKMMLPIPGLSS